MKTETIIKGYKEENKLFVQRLGKTNIVNLGLIEYLQGSLNSDDEYLKGWEYLKNNLNAELKAIIHLDSKYWDLEYNDEKKEYLLNHFYTTEEINNINPDVVIDHKEVGVLSQLSSFVYVWNDIRRKCKEQEKEQNLKIDLEKQGFKEIDTIRITKEELKTISSEDLDKRYKEHYIKYDGLKVLCVLDVNSIGILGSFDKKVAKEGKLCYSEYHKVLMLIPKRCRTKGHLIKDKCYIKEVEK